MKKYQKDFREYKMIKTKLNQLKSKKSKKSKKCKKSKIFKNNNRKKKNNVKNKIWNCQYLLPMNFNLCKYNVQYICHTFLCHIE